MWLVGMHERSTGRRKLFLVENRDHNTLAQLIRDNIGRGSTIHTDGWRGYQGIDRLEGHPLRHKRFVHAANARRPANRRGTNGIESYWGEIKHHIYRQYATHGQERCVEMLVMEAAWRVMTKQMDMTVECWETLNYISRTDLLYRRD